MAASGTDLLRQHLKSIWSRRGAICALTATVVVASLPVIVRQPDVYGTMTVVRIRDFSEAPLRRGLPGEHNIRPDALILTTHSSMLRQEVLEPVVEILYPEAGANNPDAIESVRRRLQYQRTSKYTFELLMQDEKPRRAADALNALMRRFLELERDSRSREAEGQLAYFKDEFAEADKEFGVARDALNTFKLENSETLPEMREGIAWRHETVRTRISMLTQLKSTAESRVAYLNEQIRLLPQRGAAPPPNSPLARSREEVRLEQSLERARADLRSASKELDKARRKYTENMPEVQNPLREVEWLKREVSAVEQSLEAAKKARLAADSAGREESPDGSSEEDPVKSALKVMERMRDEAIEAAAAVAKVIEEQKPIEVALAEDLARVPITKAGLDPLERELGQAAEKRKLAASALTRAEDYVIFLQRSSVADVTPYDWVLPATVPLVPIGPQRVRTVLMVLAGTLAAACGLAVLLDRVRARPVSNLSQIAHLLPGAMLVSVPVLGDGSGHFPHPQRVSMRGVLITLYVAACVAVAAMIAASFYGWAGAPDWIRALAGR